MEQNAITYNLEPGYIFASAHGAIIRTVVGSCVAICLWDGEKRFGGMNHFLYPQILEKGKTTAEYGNVAIPALVKLLENLGSVRKNIVAQIYGGGKLHNVKKNTVGEENISIARKQLRKQKIPIISEDVGGRMGRKIIFDTESGQVAVLKVHRLREADWIEGHVKS